MERIKFGTSGWRGVIAREFTFERAALVVGAIATYLRETGEAAAGVLVACDPRFMGREFAEAAARQLADNGIDVYLCDRPTPTPAVSLLLLEMRLAGGVNFTASHNPARYQGLKFSPSWGGPAMPDTTARIEDLAAGYMKEGLPSSGAVRGKIRDLDPVPGYLAGLGRAVDLGRVAETDIPLVYDALYGAGAGFLDAALEAAGCQVEVIHAEPDPTFGGGPPDPSEERLTALSARVREIGGMGLATDGDADRFGIVGPDGRFYQPNTVLALLADYVLRRRKMDGDLARSVATTHMLDTVAGAFGRRCHETPVGFKYIGEMIHQGRLALGGEESAGMSIGGHIPEKDGILACLLTAEMSAVTGKSMPELKADLDQRYGSVVTRRVNMPMDEAGSGRLREILAAPPQRVGSFEAHRMVTVDGTKWIFADGSWTLLRLSGTEPVARLYLEAPTEEAVGRMKEAFGAWIAEYGGEG